MAATPNAASTLKFLWTMHFLLSSWAMLSSYLPVRTYFYTQCGYLAFGFWAIVSEERTDAVMMCLVTMVLSMLNDAVCLAIYEPRGYDAFERNAKDLMQSQVTEYRFALGMTIANLIVKPVSVFLLFLMWRARRDGTEFHVPVLRYILGDTPEDTDNRHSNTRPPYGQTHPTMYQYPPPAGSFQNPDAPSPSYQATPSPSYQATQAPAPSSQNPQAPTHSYQAAQGPPHTYQIAEGHTISYQRQEVPRV